MLFCFNIIKYVSLNAQPQRLHKFCFKTVSYILDKTSTCRSLSHSR